MPFISRLTLLYVGCFILVGLILPASNHVVELTASADAAKFTVEKVVAAGDPSPAGGTFDNFDCPACLGSVNHFGLNDSSEVAFLATLSTGAKGVFVASPGSSGFAVRKVAVTGDPDPAGGAFTAFSAPSINSTGDVAFAGTGSKQAIFVASPTEAGFSITKVAATNDPTPVGGIFSGLWPTQQVPSINNNGEVAFVANVLGGSVGHGIFYATPGPGGFTLAKVVAPGDSSPVGAFAGFSPFTSLNDSGLVAFAGCVSTCNTPNNGLFVATPSLGGAFSIAKVVKQGDPSPTGGSISDFNLPHLNAAGQVAFMGCVSGCSLSTKNVFLASPTENEFDITKVVSSGEPAPSGGTFSGIHNTPSLNNAQQVGFLAGVSGGPAGVFLGRSTPSGFLIDKVAVDGDPSPIGGTLGLGGPPLVNGLTQTAFYAVVNGGSATSGIFLALPDSDGDGLGDESDPCPVEPDCDGDGWTDWLEAVFIGTDPLDACADNLSDDAHPADLNSDTFFDISDIVALTSNFGESVPPAPARHDIAPNPVDGLVDVSDIAAVTALFGQSCA